MTRIPVHRNAKILRPSTASARWPVMVFSHGLGGSRNAYSYICGSLASYGIIVIAPDHRDSSAPISFVRATNTTPATTIGYKKQSHTPSPEVYQARDAQLKIRLWEMGCIHDTIVKMDLGTCPENLDPNTEAKGQKTDVLEMFKSMMDLHRPGSIIWAGHSFGAATTVQLLKHSYYGPPKDDEKDELSESLFTPSRDSALVKQITSSSVALLLDMWCLPLRSKSTRWLWNKPMPCYDLSNNEKLPAGGQAICTVLSEAFIKWDGNANDTKRTLSPSELAPNSDIQWHPYFFYPSSSAHLSQSDFGILFPWILAKFLKTKEPERLMRLNARAMLQTLRVNGYEIAPPQPMDLETEEPTSKVKATQKSANGTATTDEKPVIKTDFQILSTEGLVRDWNWVPLKAGRQEDSDGESAMHVEEDYQTPGREMDEAEVLDFRTPGSEKGEEEALGLTMTKTRTRGSRKGVEV
jgi:platelet-activating factor acetylhydrolase